MPKNFSKWALQVKDNGIRSVSTMATHASYPLLSCVALPDQELALISRCHKSATLAKCYSTVGLDTSDHRSFASRDLPGDDARNYTEDDQDGDQYAAHELAGALLNLLGIHQSSGTRLYVLHRARYLRRWPSPRQKPVTGQISAHPSSRQSEWSSELPPELC